MSLLERYVEYFADFEKTVIDDDWERLKRYFTRDAVYKVSGLTEAELHGVPAVFAGIKKALNSFDRWFDGRTHEPDEPLREEANTVSAVGKIIYVKAGLPPLVLRGSEVIHYDSEGLITLIINVFPLEQPDIVAWVAKHNPQLECSYV